MPRLFSILLITIFTNGISFGNLLNFSSADTIIVESKNFVCFSMNAAKERVEKSLLAGEDFRKTQPNLFLLGGITKPVAVLFDNETNDWILIGENIKNSSALTLDDWVVALKSRKLFSKEDPGVTINPPVGFLKTDTIQNVKFFAGIKNSHFGQVCYEADWAMKMICLGLKKVPINDFASYYDLIERYSNNEKEGSNARGRFWFYPIMNRVNVMNDLVLLEKFKMGLFSEALSVVDGTPIYYSNDTIAKSFANSMTQNYEKISESEPIFKTLRGITQLSGLAKGVFESDWNISTNINYWLSDYPVAFVKTPETVEILENNYYGGTIRGGVCIAALTSRLQNGDSKAFGELVIKSKEVSTLRSNLLTWHFDIETIDGLPNNISVPILSDIENSDENLYLQAKYFQRINEIDAAIKYYELAASKGISEAMFDLGLLYHENKIISSDNLKKAAEWYKRAIEKGDVRAIHNLGALYLEGDTPNYAKAREQYEKSAKMGVAESMYGLGILYYYGRGVNTNYMTAKEWYEKAVENGYIDATNNIGWMSYNGNGVKKNFEIAKKWFEEGAKKGNNRAMNNLGMMYTKGLGITQDFEKAKEWFEKAALDGNAKAMISLGWLYSEGKGVSQNWTKAKEWNELAAEKGDEEAMNNLGLLFEQGLGVQRDYNKANEWYEKASEKGNVKAINNLGSLFKQGLGVQRDYNKASDWYKKAAEKGDSSAMYSLGTIYENGLGVLKNYTVAIQWYEKAAKKGNSEAMNHLGALYEQGIGVPQSHLKAKEWYENSANNDYGDAMFNLGRFYAFGHGVPQSYSKAKMWFIKAAEKGSSIAMYNLSVFYFQGKGVLADEGEAMIWLKKAARAGHLKSQELLNSIGERW